MGCLYHMPSPEDSVTITEKAQKNFKSQRLGETISSRQTGPDHCTHTTIASCYDLHKIKSINIPARRTKGSLEATNS